ncbi:MAG: ATP-binding protein [Bifidobacterium sp.]|nr:ATP-binding protein [Bifidobacterium sp.]
MISHDFGSAANAKETVAKSEAAPNRQTDCQVEEGQVIPRTLESYTRKLATWFPVVSVTGPRQSGKSTLIRHVFKDYEYLNLEDPEVRRAAALDPVGFIRDRPAKLIIDEAQYVPDLFSMIQVESDERNTPGQYIISGSQNFLMLKNIKQSLAGRVGIMKLLPLSFAEAQASERKPSVDEFMLRGGYPRLYDIDISLGTYFRSYTDSYIERDVTDYLDVRNSTDFRTFLRLCAQNAGNLVNYTGMADDLGVSFRTVKSWLSILESSYITFPLMPYYKSVGKRLVKTPKLYFYDTGLLCNLLGIRSLQELLVHPKLGAVFENLIVAETAKRCYNAGEEPELYFYRDESKREIDLVDLARPAEPLLLEVKSSRTYNNRQSKSLAEVGEELGVPPEHRAVIYRGSEQAQMKKSALVRAADYLRFDYPEGTLPVEGRKASDATDILYKN